MEPRGLTKSGVGSPLDTSKILLYNIYTIKEEKSLGEAIKKLLLN